MSSGKLAAIALIGAVASALALADPSDGSGKPAVEPAATTTPRANKESPMDVLKNGVGVWDADVTFWFQPGAEPVKTKATLTAAMTLEGKYLEQRMEGDMGPAMGNKKWSTLSVNWYDPQANELHAARFTSSMPLMIAVKGKVADPKRIELAGEYQLMGGKATSRDVLIDEGPDSRRIESYMSFGNVPEFKGMEMVLKRRK